MWSQKAACFTTSGLSVLMAHVVSYFWMESIDKCSTRGPSLLRGKAVCKASEQIRSTKLKSVVTLHSMRCTLHLKRKQTQAPEITRFFSSVFFFFFFGHSQPLPFDKYITTHFTTRCKNSPESHTSSVMQL